LINEVELGRNVMKGTEYLVSLQMSVVSTEEFNVAVKNEKFVRTTEYLTL